MAFFRRYLEGMTTCLASLFCVTVFVNDICGWIHPKSMIVGPMCNVYASSIVV